MAKFPLGRVCTTRRVLRDMSECPAFARFVADMLFQYQNGVWGDLSAADQAANDAAVKRGCERILGAYRYPGDSRKIWIITEADHSVTTVLYPSEY